MTGATRHAGNSSDGIITRHQIARVLVDNLTSDQADHTTFELVAEHLPEQLSLDSVFAALDYDPKESIDGVRDQQNLPLAHEPESVLADLKSLANRT